MKQKNNIDDLIKNIVAQVQTMLDNFKDIKPLRDGLQNKGDGGITGHGAFGDKLGNNLVPLYIFGTDALEATTTAEKDKNIQNMLDCYNSPSDKPAYPNESKPIAMHRTLKTLEKAMHEELTAEQFPANGFAAIKASLLALDKDMKALNTIAHDTQSPQR